MGEISTHMETVSETLLLWGWGETGDTQFGKLGERVGEILGYILVCLFKKELFPDPEVGSRSELNSLKNVQNACVQYSRN